ncbi:HAD-IA family hydrolase [Kitasatospora sp. NPDC048239]|uniref:HAD-IA family hydrolase n=1 Tax=Kitasatospora sp. NPDC048239 TaxID=3364046 RepID=UPI003718F6DF
MPLLLLDLDNTLLPRDAAFRAWAQDFLAERRLPPGDVDWLVTIDGGGYVPRSTVLSAAQRRYGLDESMEFLIAHYRRGINSHIHCPSRHIDALRAARAAGWTLGIVSNGSTRPQLEKIRRTGLGPLVDGWVISEEAECLKPDPLIFEIAAQRCGVAPTGDWTSHTWMVGDHAPADIAGAELAGLRSVWLHHGRPWAEPGYRPTLKAAGLPEAVGQVLSARNAPGPRPGIRAGGPLQSRAACAVPAGPWNRSGTAAAPGSARPSARIALSAPDGPRAPSPAQGPGGGAPGASTRSAVRNRSGEVAESGDGPPAGSIRSATPPVPERPEPSERLEHPEHLEHPARPEYLEHPELPGYPARTRFAMPPASPVPPVRSGPVLRPAVPAPIVGAAVAG